MVFLTEEKVQKLTESGVWVPQINDKCISCSACVAIGEDIFWINENEEIWVKELDSYEEEKVNDVISACPVNAIYWKK